MIDWRTITESFQGLLAQACLFALLVIVCVCTAVKFFGLSRSSLSRLWRMSRMGLAALTLLSVTMGLWADKTNLLRQVIHPWSFGDPQVVVVSETDILRGYRLDGIATNEMPFCEMPTNAVEYAPFRLSGGRERSFPLNLGDFVFPYGTNSINRFRVLSGGTIETYPRLNAPASICAAREYASLIPGVSRFWSADENDGAEKVLRRDSVFANRDRTGEYTAEIKLCANGDFSTRSNALETVYRRVNPNDWDGDGLANEIDANPTTSDGDFFGTGVGWLNVNCAGVLSAATNGMGEVEISWHTNANPNAYYWLDLAATGALGVAKITATCDGESFLGDMTVIARTNEVCHIPLLIGATYTVESDLPIAYSAVSSEHANILTNSEHSLVVSFPLEFSFEPIRAASSFRLVSLPVDVNAMLVSVLGGCCSCQTNDVGFTWSCAEGCLCGGGGYMLSSTATWQGYSALFTDWCSCPCPPVITPEGDQGDPSPRLILDSPHAYFTNTGGHAEPSDVVHVRVGLASPVATNGYLRLEESWPGHVNVWANSNRTCAVSLPMEWGAEEMPLKNIYIEGADTILFDSLSLTWRDGNYQEILSTNVDFGVFCPVLDVINSSLSDNGDLCNPVGIVTGTNACFALSFIGQAPLPLDISWLIVEGDAWFVDDINQSERVRVESDYPYQRITLRAQIADCRSRPPEISAYVVDPMSVKLTVWIVGDDFGTYYPIEEPAVSNMVAYANKTFEQIGVSFYIDTISYTNHYAWLKICDNAGNQDLVKRRELVDITKNSNGLEIYFIDNIGKNIKANNDLYGIVVSTNWTISTLAHEIGHSFGCADIYTTHRDNTSIGLSDNKPKRNHAPYDWNNGDGCRYYNPDLTQKQLIERMLMCGYETGFRKDISAGSVYGFNRTNERVNVDTGFIKNEYRRNLRMHQ